MSSIKTIKKNSITKEVYTQLKNAISSGEWAPGEKVPSENELASRMGVSRISIRAAIQQLAGLGLVESRQGEGTFVCELDGTQHLNQLIPAIMLTKTNLKNVLELRMVIEGKCAALAAERCPPEILEEMKDIYRRHSESHDVEEYAGLDFAFHHAIAKATGNPLIEQVFSIMYNSFSNAFHEIVSAMGTEGAMYYHDMIIKAIEDHDAKAAEEIMDQHVKVTIVFLEKESIV